MSRLEVHEDRVAKVKGASPSEDRCYIMVMFDISNRKKYGWLSKVLKGYCNRIQFSVYEAYLNDVRIRELMSKLKRIMESERYFDPNDRVRVYRISANCEVTAFGEYVSNIPERDVFI